MAQKLVTALASRVQAMRNCEQTGNLEWFARHRETLHELVRDRLPSGCGFDNGTVIQLDDCKPDKLVLHTSFHHMSPHGFYDGWTEHKITVRPSLVHGFTIEVGGRDRSYIKNYIAEIFQAALSQEIDA